MTTAPCTCYACGRPLPQPVPQAITSAQWDADLLALLAADLGRETDGYRALWTLIRSPEIHRVAQWADELGVGPSTFGSRWSRAGLPSPRRYVTAVRLIRVARLWERPGLTAFRISIELDFAAPQNLARYVRQELGLTIAQARLRYTAADLAALFRDELVLPHLEALRLTPFLTSDDLRVERRHLTIAQIAQSARASQPAVEVAA